MLTHPTSEKLQALRLLGMAKALDEQRRMPEIQDLSFEERLGLMVDREVTERDNRRLSSRLRKAKFRPPDIDPKTRRNSAIQGQEDRREI